MDSEVIQKSILSSSKIYHQLARHYDRIFAPMFQARIHATVESLQIPAGAKVLEIGVGTGISLTAYPPHADVLGVDLSAKMLDQAAKRVEMCGLTNVQLQPMNALDLELPNEQFDFVMAFHVVSVVDDVERMLNEMFRVCQPGGTIVVINHFRSKRPWLAALIDRASPLTKRWGWRTDLRLEEVTGPVPLRVEKQFKTSSFSLFTVLVATKPDHQTNGSRAEMQRQELER